MSTPHTADMNTPVILRIDAADAPGGLMMSDALQQAVEASGGDAHSASLVSLVPTSEGVAASYRFPGAQPGKVTAVPFVADTALSRQTVHVIPLEAEAEQATDAASREFASQLGLAVPAERIILHGPQHLNGPGAIQFDAEVTVPLPRDLFDAPLGWFIAYLPVER